MELYLLRHGIAVEHGAPGFENDAVRPLTPKGKRQMSQIAAAMKRMELSFDLILSSPLVRAKQTAEIVVEKLKLKKRLKFSDELKPAGNVKKLFGQLNELKPAPENILLVGHEPYMKRLISLLMSGGDNAAIDFKKGGLCKLEVGKMRPGFCAKLVWLVTPKQLKLMR